MEILSKAKLPLLRGEAQRSYSNRKISEQLKGLVTVASMKMESMNIITERRIIALSDQKRRK